MFLFHLRGLMEMPNSTIWENLSSAGLRIDVKKLLYRTVVAVLKLKDLYLFLTGSRRISVIPRLEPIVVQFVVCPEGEVRFPSMATCMGSLTQDANLMPFRKIPKNYPPYVAYGIPTVRWRWVCYKTTANNFLLTFLYQ